MDCRRIAGCRACGDGDLRSILDLGWQRLAGRFPGPDEPDPPGFPLELLRCNGGCGLVQLSHTVRPDLQFRDYYYRSAISDTMRGHLRGLAVEASGKVHDEPGLSRRVLDIGCNDGTLLGYTPFGHGRRYGIDPCGLPVDGEGIVCHCGYFPDDVPRGWPSFDLIFSVACFYDVDDPVIFAEAVRDSLTPDGLWCIEVAHLPDVVGLASYDTVLHEHLCYYDLETLHFVLSMAGLRVVDHSFNTCNNGTLRVWAARGVRGLGGVRTEYDWPAFAARVRAHKAELLDYLDSCRRQGKRVHLLGASAKANTVLQYCGIDPDLVQAASDRDPRKRGHRTPGSGIPILSEADSRATHPDVYLTVLTHFRDELIERERAAGFRGQFVFALPSLEVVQL